MKSSLLRLGRLYTIVLALVAGTFAPGGLFVCLGLDGHVAVESTAGGCEDERPAPGGDVVTRCAEEECGSCFDLGLDRSTPPRSALAADRATSLDPVVLPHGVAADPLRVTLPVAPSPDPHPDRTASAVRSTILRC